MEDHEAHVPADPFDLGAVSESVSRESAPQARVAEVRSRRTVKPDFTVVRVEPHHGSQPRYELYSTTVHKAHSTQGKRTCRVPAGPETRIYVYDEDKPSVRLSHMEHFSPTTRRTAVRGSRSRSTARSTGRVDRPRSGPVEGGGRDSRRWAHRRARCGLVSHLRARGQPDLRSQPGRRDLDLRRVLLVGRTRSTSI